MVMKEMKRGRNEGGKKESRRRKVDWKGRK